MSSRRREFLGALGAVIAMPVTSLGQAGRKFRIGVVDNTIPVADLSGPIPRDPNARAFVERLSELGWIDGKNIEILWRSAETNYERRPQIIADLVRLPADAILVYGNVATREAMQATRTIPIVMVNSQDPVRLKLIASLARPGGNVTGIDMVLDASVTGKRLAFLKEAAPSVKKVAFLAPRTTADIEFAPETTRAAKDLGLTLTRIYLEGPTPFEKGFAEVARQGANGLHLGGNSPIMALQNQRMIRALVERYRLPAAHNSPDFTNAGAILNFGPDQRGPHQRAASLVDRILRGSKPGELPVEMPLNLVLVANVRAARAIGLTIPPSFLAQADRVIE